ncbi:MAG: hypothetical protein QXN33_04495 [Candidatus Bathyarchaeia archaeon]
MEPDSIGVGGGNRFIAFSLTDCNSIAACGVNGISNIAHIR